VLTCSAWGLWQTNWRLNGGKAIRERSMNADNEWFTGLEGSTDTMHICTWTSGTNTTSWLKIVEFGVNKIQLGGAEKSAKIARV
jgi:hypothetical protein